MSQYLINLAAKLRIILLICVTPPLISVKRIKIVSRAIISKTAMGTGTWGMRDKFKFYQ